MIGDEVSVELAPEGPQRGDLADDIAAALAADPAAGVAGLLAVGVKERPRPCGRLPGASQVTTPIGSLHRWATSITP